MRTLEKTEREKVNLFEERELMASDCKFQAAREGSNFLRGGGVGAGHPYAMAHPTTYHAIAPRILLCRADRRLGG